MLAPSVLYWLVDVCYIPCARAENGIPRSWILRIPFGYQPI